MAKKSAINRNEHVKRLVKRFEAKRARLKALANDESKPLEERSTYDRAFLQVMNLWERSARVAHFVVGRRLGRSVGEPCALC